MSLLESIFGGNTTTTTTATTTDATVDNVNTNDNDSSNNTKRKKKKRKEDEAIAGHDKEEINNTGLFDTKFHIDETPKEYYKRNAKGKIRKDNKKRKLVIDNDDGIGAVVAEEKDDATTVEKAENADTTTTVTVSETTTTTTTTKPDQVNIDYNEQNSRTIYVGNLPLSTTRTTLEKLFHDCGKIESTRIRSIIAKGVKLPQNLAGKQHLVQKICTNTHQYDDTYKKSISGYVRFHSIGSVNKALLKNNMIISDDNNNNNNNNNNSKDGDNNTTITSSTNNVRHIRVDRATPEYDTKRTVFVGNLPYSTDEETLKIFFEEILQKHVIITTDNDDDDQNNNNNNIVENVRIVRNKETGQCKGFGYVLFTNISTVPIALKYCNGQTYMNKQQLRVQICGKRYKTKHGNNNNNNTDNNNPKGQKDNNNNGTNNTNNSIGALRRILAKQQKEDNINNKRKRGTKTKSNNNKKAISGTTTTTTSTGKSKRTVLEVKANKRIKKLEKRMKHGMGKNKVGKK